MGQRPGRDPFARAARRARAGGRQPAVRDRIPLALREPANAPDPVIDEDGFIAALARAGETLDGAGADVCDPRRARERDRPPRRQNSARPTVRSRLGQCSSGSRASATSSRPPSPAASRCRETLHPRSAAEAHAAATSSAIRLDGQAVRPTSASGGSTTGSGSGARRRPSSRPRSLRPSRSSQWCRSTCRAATSISTASAAISAADGEALGALLRPQAAPDARHMGVCRVAEAVWVHGDRRPWAALLQRALGSTASRRSS